MIGDVYTAGKIDVDSAGRQYSLKAKGDCRATFVPFWKWHELAVKHPGFDADFRAGRLCPEHLLLTEDAHLYP